MCIDYGLSCLVLGVVGLSMVKGMKFGMVKDGDMLLLRFVCNIKVKLCIVG